MNFDTATVRRLRDALLDRQIAEPGSAKTHAAAREATVGRVAPFLETMYLVMMADGVAEPAERAAINGAIAILTQGVLDEASVVGLLEQCEKRAAIQGVEPMLQAIGARLSADRADAETAFSLSAAVALADQTVDQHEHALIEKLVEWFGLSEKRAMALISDL
jgi:tellurite resistance protein